MQLADRVAHVGRAVERDDAGVVHHLHEDNDVVAPLNDLVVAVVAGQEVGYAKREAPLAQRPVCP